MVTIVIIMTSCRHVVTMVIIMTSYRHVVTIVIIMTSYWHVGSEFDTDIKLDVPESERW